MSPIEARADTVVLYDGSLTSRCPDEQDWERRGCFDAGCCSGELPALVPVGPEEPDELAVALWWSWRRGEIL